MKPLKYGTKGQGWVSLETIALYLLTFVIRKCCPWYFGVAGLPRETSGSVPAFPPSSPRQDYCSFSNFLLKGK